MFKSREEKQAEQMQSYIQKYRLDDLDPRDLETVKRIALDLAGNGALKVGLAFSFANAADQATVSYLSALVEQNWLIINQLSRLNKNFEGMKSK